MIRAGTEMYMAAVSPQACRVVAAAESASVRTHKTKSVALEETHYQQQKRAQRIETSVVTNRLRLACGGVSK